MQGTTWTPCLVWKGSNWNFMESRTGVLVTGGLLRGLGWWGWGLCAQGLLPIPVRLWRSLPSEGQILVWGGAQAKFAGREGIQDLLPSPSLLPKVPKPKDGPATPAAQDSPASALA